MEFKNENPDILKGLKVLDLTDWKGSFCSKILADLGVEVIKIETTLGEDTNKTSSRNKTYYNIDTLPYVYNNIDKRRITLDLDQDDGRAKFLGLVKSSDALIESFTPGRLKKNGIHPNVLIKTNPEIIIVSITGFGRTGPRKNYKSCDLISSSFGGQMYINGSPSGRPLNTFGSQSLYSASLYAVIGLMLALRKRKIMGEGECVDVSMQEAVISTLEHPMIRFFHDQSVSKRQGSLHWNNSFFISPCKDGFIHMTIFQQWETLVEWLDSEGQAMDLKEKKWRNEEYQNSHLEHVLDVLANWTMNHTVNELFKLGQLMHFPWAPVCSLGEVLKSPQLEHRGFFRDIDHPATGLKMKCPGLPYKFYAKPNNTPRELPMGDMDRKINDETEKGILRGVRVLDLTRVLAGPYVTRLLADFGAEVIKVQTKKTSTGAEADDSAYFCHWNRNKLGITLDLGKREARELFTKLVAKCDVVIENFSPRVIENWGFDYETLAKYRHDLIMLRMSGMGQTGPWKDFAIFGPTIQSLSGITYLTSYDEKRPLGPGNSYADIIAGLYGGLITLSSLEYRDRTGRGLFIDLSEYEALCTIIGPSVMDISASRRELIPPETSFEQMYAAPYGCYKCLGTDRWCTIAVFTEDEWQGFCRVLGRPSWTDNKVFSTLKGRLENRKQLDIYTEEWTSGKDAESIVGLLQREGVPAGIVQNAYDLANDPHLKERKFFREIDYTLSGKRMTDSYPFRFSDKLEITLKSSPLLGEHNNYVFKELIGLEEKTITQYREMGIIA